MALEVRIPSQLTIKSPWKLIPFELLQSQVTVSLQSLTQQRRKVYFTVNSYGFLRRNLVSYFRRHDVVLLESNRREQKSVPTTDDQQVWTQSLT